MVLPPQASDNDRAAEWVDEYWDAEPDWEWHSAAEDSAETLHARWRDAVARSRDLLAETLARDGLDQLARRSLPDGRTPTVRWIVEVERPPVRHLTVVSA